MAIDYVQTDRANLYVSQNRGAAANKYAEEADNAVKQINTIWLITTLCWTASGITL